MGKLNLTNLNGFIISISTLQFSLAFVMLAIHLQTTQGF